MVFFDLKASRVLPQVAVQNHKTTLFKNSLTVLSLGSKEGLLAVLVLGSSLL